MKLSAVFLLVFLAASASAAAVRFCAVGDILLDRHIRQKIEENDLHYPLSLAKALIKGHDLAFCNVESSISTRGQRVKGMWRFRGDAAFVPMLSEAGFNLACVANNHTLDYGREAFTDTMDALAAGGLTPIGGGKTQALAIAPTYVTMEAMTIAFIGNEDVPLDGFTNLPGHSKLPGPAQATIETIEASVRKAKQHADLVVVSQHWGIEYEDQPRPYQVQWAHRIIDAGASLLIGHHPHVLQPLESYHGGTIIYSLGNFVFDQKFPRQTQTVIFECEFQKDGVHAVRLLPMRIDENFRPQPPTTPEDASQILAWMDAISRPFATRWALSGTAAAYPLSPTVQFQGPAAGGDLLVDSRGLHWSLPNQKPVHWDVPSGMQLSQGIGQADGGSYRVYSVLSPVSRSARGQLSVFTLKDRKILGPELVSRRLDVWKLALEDIDHDGKNDLCVGVQQGLDRKVLVFDRHRASLDPKKVAPVLRTNMLRVLEAGLGSKPLN
jgi:poly-gamma-glutamate synthesis protein (capsule biosynthesis protein)